MIKAGNELRASGGSKRHQQRCTACLSAEQDTTLKDFSEMFLDNSNS